MAESIVGRDGRCWAVRRRWMPRLGTVRSYLQFPPFPPDHLTNSLDHLAQLATR